MSEPRTLEERLKSALEYSKNHPLTQIENITNSLDEKELELKALKIEIKDLKQNLAEREKTFISREKALRDSSLEVDLRNKQLELDKDILRKQSNDDRHAFEEKVDQLEKEKDQLKKEKEKYQAETQKRIEDKASEYVNQAIDALKIKEILFFWTSFAWSIAGGVSIAGGLIALLLSLHDATKDIIANKEIGWMLIIFLAAKSAVLLGIMFAFAKYSMMFSKSYMHESLRNTERQHAINFGKFYLGTHGASASWEDIKSVFEHWNISRDSTFLSPEKSVTSEQPNTPISWNEAGEAAKSIIDAGKRILTPEKQT